MTHRSLLLPGESFNDMMDALNKASSPEERKRIASDRMKANGWTREKELSFREHAATCGFILPGQKAKANPLAKDSAGRTNARLLADAIKHDFRQTKTLNGDMEDQ